MNLHTARKVIFDEQDASIGRLAMACVVMADPKHADEVSLPDLLVCLERGNKFGRLTIISETAALALYSRTGRTRSEPVVPFKDFVTDTEDWRKYLREHNLL